MSEKSLDQLEKELADLKRKEEIEKQIEEMKAKDEPIPSFEDKTAELERKMAAMEEENSQLRGLAPVRNSEDELSALANFKPEDERRIKDIAKSIMISDSGAILNYGSDIQTKMNHFADKALAKTRTQDLDEIGDLLDGMMGQLNSIKANDVKGNFITKFFKNKQYDIESMKSKYDNIEQNIQGISTELMTQQNLLLKDISYLDALYEANEEYYKELTYYIEAGNRRIKEIKENELPPLVAKAQESGNSIDAQEVSTLENQINRFEKKVYDLELTRQVSIQMMPQVRMIQASNAIMAEKIQTTIVNTIPLWKTQFTLALGMEHTEKALRTQEAVTNMTNQLLKENAKKLKQNTIDTAKATERGIIDIETIDETSKMLVDTIEEVNRIRIEGKQKRQEATQQMRQLESSLVNNLSIESQKERQRMLNGK